MNLKIKFIPILTIIFLSFGIFSIANISKTDEYSVELPDNFVEQDNAMGKAYNSSTHQGSSIGFRTQSNYNLKDELVEEVYSTLTLNQFADAIVKNVDADPSCKNTTVINKRITTFNNYKAFYYYFTTETSLGKANMWEYVIFSDNHTYEIMLSSISSNYIDSDEVKNIEKTFTILDTTNFYKNISKTPSKNSSVGTESTQYHKDKNTTQLRNGIDYIIIYIGFVILGIILMLIIHKNGKNVKRIGIVIILFILQLFSVIQQVSEGSTFPNSFNIYTIAGYVGYFFIAEIAIVLLIVEVVKSKK